MYTADATGFMYPDWEHDEIDGSALASRDISDIKTIVVKNTKLFDNKMVSRAVKVKYILSNEDMNLIRQYYDKYKTWRAAEDKKNLMRPRRKSRRTSEARRGSS